MGEIVNKKVQNISRYLERYPDDRNVILQAIELICSCTSIDEIALDSI